MQIKVSTTSMQNIHYVNNYEHGDGAKSLMSNLTQSGISHRNGTLHCKVINL
jgi:hypothetical protein